MASGERCVICGNSVEVMCFRGTGICSEQCYKKSKQSPNISEEN